MTFPIKPIVPKLNVPFSFQRDKQQIFILLPWHIHKKRIKTSIELFWQFSFPRINNFLSTITKEKQNNEYLTENIYPPPPWSGIVTHRVIQDFLRIDFSFHFQTTHLDGFINYKIKAKDTFTFLSQREFLWSESMFVKEQNAFITVPSFPSFSLSL